MAKPFCAVIAVISYPIFHSEKEIQKHHVMPRHTCITGIKYQLTYKNARIIIDLTIFFQFYNGQQIVRSIHQPDGLLL